MSNTSLDILNLAAQLVDGGYCALLDPWGGDGSDIDFLAGKWHSSRHVVEPDGDLAERARKHAKVLEGVLKDVMARNFLLVWAHPPDDLKNPVPFLREVANTLVPGEGILLLRLNKKTLVTPAVIKALAHEFKDWQSFREPPPWWDMRNHFILRMRRREEQCPDENLDTAIQALVSEIEGARALEHPLPSPWKTAYTRGTTFRMRGLEWEDVLSEALEALPGLALADGIPIPWEIEKDDDEAYVNVPGAQTWALSWCYSGGKMFFLAHVGRKGSLNAVEGMMKHGKTFKLGYDSVTIAGGATGLKEEWDIRKIHLPNTNCWIHVWIHRALTPRATSIDPAILVGSDTEDILVMEHNAKVLSAKLSLPISPSWIDAVGSVYGGGHWGRRVGRVNLNVTWVDRDRVRERLTALAKEGDLPSPTPMTPERIRPIMPPSIGIWAQLAMQEFINCVPLDNRIIMYACPITITDRDEEESIQGVVEYTNMIRKDAVRIEVFHFAGRKKGTWETYETERLEDDDSNP